MVGITVGTLALAEVDLVTMALRTEQVEATDTGLHQIILVTRLTSQTQLHQIAQEQLILAILTQEEEIALDQQPTDLEVESL